MNLQKLKSDEGNPIPAPHPNDVISGRGNETIAYAHPGNVHFRSLVKCYKLQYVASKKSDKPAFAKAIVLSIKKKSPPGRFLKQDKNTGLWHDIGYKLSLAKTRQALREGAPLIGKQLQRHKDEKKRLEEEQQRQLQENLQGAMSAAVIQRQSTLDSTNPLVPNISDSTLMDLLNEKRASIGFAPQRYAGNHQQDLQGYINQLHMIPTSLHSSPVLHLNPTVSMSNRARDDVASSLLTGNLDILSVNNGHLGSSTLTTDRIGIDQKVTRAAIAHHQAAAISQRADVLGSGLSGAGIFLEQMLAQVRQNVRREDSIMAGAISLSQKRVIELLHEQRRNQQQHLLHQKLRQLEGIQLPCPVAGDSNTQEVDAMGALLLLKERNQMQVKNG